MSDSYSSEQLGRAVSLALGTGHLRLCKGANAAGEGVVIIGFSEIEAQDGDAELDLGEPLLILWVPATDKAINGCRALAMMLTQVADAVEQEVTHE